MMGVAGGLAKTGFLPFAVTYGVFATRRAYDQVAMALATGPSRGIVVAFLPGITTPFKATHQAIDDLALMRALAGNDRRRPGRRDRARRGRRARRRSTTGPSTSAGCAARSTQLFEPDGFELGSARRRRRTAASRDRLDGARRRSGRSRRPSCSTGERRSSTSPTLKPFPAEAVRRRSRARSTPSRLSRTTRSSADSARRSPRRLPNAGAGTRLRRARRARHAGRRQDRSTTSGAQLGLDAAGIAEAVAVTVASRTASRSRERAHAIRRTVLGCAVGRGQGYAGQGLGLADLMACLYFSELREDRRPLRALDGP